MRVMLHDSFFWDFTCASRPGEPDRYGFQPDNGVTPHVTVHYTPRGSEHVFVNRVVKR